MEDLAENSIQAHLIGRGLEQFNYEQCNSRDVAALFSSLEKFQREIQDCSRIDEVLNFTRLYIESLNLFEAVGFYMVDPRTILFELNHCWPNESKSRLENFLSKEIEEGRFAWALQQNRSLLVPVSVEVAKGGEAMLHGMSTHNRTFGMFVGLLSGESVRNRNPVQSILTFIITTAVYVIENDTLQDELTEHNKILEDQVQSRTRKLELANRKLYNGNVELKRLNEQKSELLGIVAHDLKNPLSVITGLVYLVKQTTDESKGLEKDIKREHLEFLAEIEVASRNMLNSIDELMNSEAIESGKIELDRGDHNLGEILDDVIALNVQKAAAKNIEIVPDIEENIIANVDSHRIHEVLDNIVSNAIKYSPHGKSIYIALKPRPKDKSSAQFSVRDEGPGFTEDDKKKLFGKFTKLSARPTGGESSTGLGLSIVKRLVEIHGGDVWLESEEGKGATFHITLPFARRCCEWKPG